MPSTKDVSSEVFMAGLAGWREGEASHTPPAWERPSGERPAGGRQLPPLPKLTDDRALREAPGPAPYCHQPIASSRVPTDAPFLRQYRALVALLHRHGHAHAQRAHEGRAPAPRVFRTQLTGVEEAADALVPSKDRLERATVGIEGQVHNAEVGRCRLRRARCTC